MKKILEVLQYGETDIRFNTDVDVSKNRESVMHTVVCAATAMVTKLWGGNELSVLAMIRALAIADLAVSVNRKEMVEELDAASRECAEMLKEAKEEFEKAGGKVMSFAPGINPPRGVS